MFILFFVNILFVFLNHTSCIFLTQFVKGTVVGVALISAYCCVIINKGIQTGPHTPSFCPQLLALYCFVFFSFSRSNVPPGRPLRLQPVRQRRSVLGVRLGLRLQLPAHLPRPDLQAGRERVRPHALAMPQRRRVRERGGLVPLPLLPGVHRPALRGALHALQPLAVP